MPSLERLLPLTSRRAVKVVASAIVDKYIGESARIIREMFGYAKEHQPCIIFMDACCVSSRCFLGSLLISCAFLAFFFVVRALDLAALFNDIQRGLLDCLQPATGQMQQ